MVQEIRFNPEFVDLYQQIWQTLRDEVTLTYQRTALGGAVA
jgi:NitT/TauT family transport system ATP-binding protein